MDQPLVFGLDAGGTTLKCALADRQGGLLAQTRVPTGADPRTALGACARFFRAEAARLGGVIAAGGVASFGPVERDPTAPRYGEILGTPKPGWSGAPVRAILEEALGVAVALDTDVNAALAAERRWGAALGARTAAYMTVGTGIGVGAWHDGAWIGAPGHPEFGHIRIARRADDHAFAGVCPFHGGCLEGLASAPALEARFGPLVDLPADHAGWDLAADYLAQACVTLHLMLRPQRIVLGGGVLLAPGLIAAIRRHAVRLMAGYTGFAADAAEALIVRAALGDDAGVKGATLLALNLLDA